MNEERLASLEDKIRELEMRINGAVGPFYEYSLEEWQRAYPLKTRAGIQHHCSKCLRGFYTLEECEVHQKECEKYEDIVENAIDRYKHDVYFHNMVDALVANMNHSSMDEGDIRQAVDLAIEIRDEERKKEFLRTSAIGGF